MSGAARRRSTFSMEHQSKLFAVLVVVIALGFGAILMQPVVEEQLAPELHTAWVAIEVAARGIATVGPVELEVGTPFKLHAVLEARDRRGRPVYYTEAPGLEIEGREVPTESLRAWDRPQPVKVRWFTVEGRRPFVALDVAQGMKSFEFQELLRSDWPVSWSVPGEIDAAHDNHLESDSPEAVQRFGTQRYHVRIELYRDENALIPERVVRSWGVADIKPRVAAFPTVRLTLPGRLGPASKVFGLTQLEAPSEAPRALLDQITELADHDVAFSRQTLLRDQIRQSGRRMEDLTWVDLDLLGETRWGIEATPGDLVRVGDRVVVLYRDRGLPEVVDYQDLCFDFVQGAAIRALSDVFEGSGNNVEHASLKPL